LLKETIAKAEILGPYEAQSGPARRNDVHTIETHLHQLTGSAQKIYADITESILKTYHK